HRLHDVVGRSQAETLRQQRDELRLYSMIVVRDDGPAGGETEQVATPFVAQQIAPAARPFHRALRRAGIHNGAGSADDHEARLAFKGGIEGERGVVYEA